jgi:hypothetical protein
MGYAISGLEIHSSPYRCVNQQSTVGVSTDKR